MPITEDPLNPTEDKEPRNEILQIAEQAGGKRKKRFGSPPQQSQGDASSSSNPQQGDAGLGADVPKRDPNKRFTNNF